MGKIRHLTNEELAALCSELSSVVSSGVTITDGIFIMMQDDTDKYSKRLFSSLLEAIEKGSTITQAFESTQAFPNYFIKMLNIGEKTGRLDSVLASLSEYYRKLSEISAGIRSATVYPTILLITVFAVMVLLTMYVIPIFNDVFNDMGLALSADAAGAASAGAVLSHLALIIIGIVAFFIIAGVMLYQLRGGFKRFIIRIFSRTSIAKTLYSARFSAALSMTLSSGLDIDSSMEMCESIIENEYMKKKISDCRKAMSEGVPFTEAFEKTGIFSPIQMRMLKIGFGTGSLDRVTAQIAESSEEKVDEVLQGAVSRFEPTLVIIMALAVGFMLISLIIPLAGVMTVIG